MWHDSETDKDFLNFSGVAGTVAEIVRQSGGQPVSVGVSGSWGAGKSSMIKLVRNELEKTKQLEGRELVFVEFNAWLYQGYDDARAALMDVIAERLQTEAQKRKTALDKTADFLKRIRWMRVARFAVPAAGSAAALALGLPPLGLLGDLLRLGDKAASGAMDEKSGTEITAAAKEVADDATGLLGEKKDDSPPKEIQALRNSFEAALSELGIVLVVLVDDLDRCLPTTTISTLEAMRLFLFLRNTAFIIAADNEMIKHAVRHHFGDVDETLVTSYFDKLIQVPIRVPPLGLQEVRAYLMLLYIENSDIPSTERETVRREVLEQLKQTWQGRRVDREFVQSKLGTTDVTLLSRLEAAERIAPIMTTASQIRGNPRLIKRFLNALSIRMAMAKAHGVAIDESVVAKVLLFERIASSAANEALVRAVMEDPEGKPRFLAPWEAQAAKGEEIEVDGIWDDPFVKEWLALSPLLGDTDLRGVMYIGREHAPLLTAGDRLSSEGAVLLKALLEQPKISGALKDKLKALSRADLDVITGRVLARAGQEQEWGTPPILDACLVLAEADVSQGVRVAAFLSERPAVQVKPNIVARLGGVAWAAEVFKKWAGSTVSGPVKNAIKAQAK